MARSPLTLAASVTSALPRVGVVGAGALTEGAAGRFDSAVAELDDGRRVVVRAPADPDAATELAAEVRALRALTPGVRGLLPFRAPELLGEAGLGDARVVVVDFLPGYRVDAAHLPPGRGAATSVGEALAALHTLPLSIVRTEGLPVRTPSQIRDDVRRLIDRVRATHQAPEALLDRWTRAVEADVLWRFESAVVLGGAGAASFLFEDIESAPHVTGLLEWHGLQVGDPATDLQWLASAPTAAADVYRAYSGHVSRAPDALVRERARLYAELEFAKWLVHGVEVGRDDIVSDAVGLLDALVESVRGDELVPPGDLDVEDAIALLGRVPEPSPTSVDTSMQTDAYDPEELSLWITTQDAAGAPADEAAADHEGTEESAEVDAPGAALFDDTSTAPLDLAELEDQAPRTADVDEEREADRASRAAFQRWTSSSSE
ncbi:phosphotransferase [Microbacterium sp. SS28]|uniref:phosphotransferase n=1 Tax=Microbacterium sp. SS28 TaxID=2919948 RepID=UPI001FAAF808|nr:phosphotransferase [Microbacterium sp. SS28]